MELFSRDWCHLCGTRQQGNVDVFYPKNAEHEISFLHNNTPNYIRICADCGAAITAIGRADVPTSCERNNPALKGRTYE